MTSVAVCDARRGRESDSRWMEGFRAAANPEARFETLQKESGDCGDGSLGETARLDVREKESRGRRGGGFSRRGELYIGMAPPRRQRRGELELFRLCRASPIPENAS